jgi:hypothetical protein
VKDDDRPKLTRNNKTQPKRNGNHNVKKQQKKLPRGNPKLRLGLIRAHKYRKPIDYGNDFGDPFIREHVQRTSSSTT